MDVNCGDILDGHHSVEEKGRQIYEMILKVASGEKSKSELQGLVIQILISPQMPP